MEGTSKKKNVKSPQEIEEGIKSIVTVNWDPFAVFPKEIYVKIFEKLENPSDKQNFMNAHMKLYNLFESKRTLFLFEDVLKKIGNINFNNCQQRLDFAATAASCRLVCHDWDKGTQRFFQLHKIYFKIEEDKKIWAGSCSRFERDYYKPCKAFSWSIGSDVDEDLERFSFTHPPSKNPFFSRRVDLKLRNWDWNNTTSIETLLERYGKHIWHCKIEISISNPDKINKAYVSILAKWLNLMPELKTLEIIHGKDYLSTNALRRVQEMQVVQPELKNLVVLKTKDLQAVIFNKLFGNLKGVEKIQFEVYNLTEPLRNFEINQENLKEAFLSMMEDDFEYLQEAEPFPNLNKLFITLVRSQTNEEWKKWPEWRMIFKILNEKFPSLENLNLRLPEAVSEEDKRAAIDHSLEYKMNLKKLKKLWIISSNLCSFDFLQNCKALEELTVVLEHSEWFRYEKMIFNNYFGNMRDSKIWKAFPKLKKLKIWAWCEPSRSLQRYRYEKIGKQRKYGRKSVEKYDWYSDSD